MCHFYIPEESRWMGLVFITFLEADRAVPIQIRVVNMRIQNDITKLICQRLLKKYQDIPKENP